MSDEERYQYSYSSKQQEEIQKIREKYIPREESKMEQLRRLDASVTKPGTKAAIILGVIGSLIFGLGMACTMEWGGDLFIPGCVIGVIGIVCMVLACPLYNRITAKQREKIAPQILALTEELSDQSGES